MRPQAQCKMKLVSSEIIKRLYLSNLLWTLAQNLGVFCILCGCRWPPKTTCDIQRHRMVPFSICCHAVVLFTGSCQMGIVMNAFIANVIKPNITGTGDETDSRGDTRCLQGSWKWVSAVCTRKPSHVPVHKCLFCQLKINFSVANAELPQSLWLLRVIVV